MHEDGIRVLVYREDAPPATDPFRLGSPTLFTTVEGDTSALLARAAFGGRSEDGDVYVWDSRELRIHRYSAGGRHLGVFGRPGEGPGEFQGLSSAYLEDAAIHVWDRGAARLSLFDLQGDLIKVHPVVGLGRSVLPEFLLPTRRSSRHAYLGTVRRTQSRLLEGLPGPTDQSGEYRAMGFSPDLQEMEVLMDSTVVAEGVALGGDRLMMQTRSPYYRQLVPISAVSKSGVLAWSYAAEYRIRLLNTNSGAQTEIRIPRRVIPVPDSLKEREYASFSRRGLVPQARRLLEFSDTLPVIGSMVWDDLGRLWVMDYRVPRSDAPTMRFEVFADSGRWLFRQDLSVYPDALFEDGLFTGTAAEDGGPAVAYYPLIKP